MADEQHELRAAIERLQAQLRATSSADPQVAAQLKATLADVELILQGQAPRSSDKTSLARRLSEAALHFEASHQTLSGTIGSVIDALGRMGI